MHKKFALEHISNIMPIPRSERELISGLLPAKGLAVLYGQPKSYKSFVALNLALAVSEGKKWCGRNVKSGPVVYVAAEGATGVRTRVAAAKEKIGNTESVPFFLISARPDFGKHGGDAAELGTQILQQLAGESPRLIILDTLARVLGEGDENGSGMQSFIKGAEELAEHCNCLVLAVHHERKNQNGGLRGHSSLAGAVVAYWRVKKKSNLEALISIEASKDDADGIFLLAKLQEVRLSSSIDGEADTTLIVEQVTRANHECKSESRKALTKSNREVLAFIRSHVKEKGEEIEGQIRVPLNDCRESFQENSSLPKGSARKAFDRGHDALVENNALIVQNIAGVKYCSLPNEAQTNGQPS